MNAIAQPTDREAEFSARAICAVWDRATVRALAVAAETQAALLDKLDLHYASGFEDDAKRLMRAARLLTQANVSRDRT